MEPIVAVVGRPNVGKSTLVNRICQSQEAIVHESRGVTRDRSYHEADWNGRDFVVVDTGGIEPLRSDDRFADPIRDQALTGAREADVVLFVVDGATGVTEEDESVARMLKRLGKPVLLLVNKCDDPSNDRALWDFYSLGVGEPQPISATHGHGTGDVLDQVVALFPDEESEPVGDAAPEAPRDPDELRVAVVGRPNVGKSSLFNRICGSERSIVSDVSGTTRDAIDTVIDRDGRTYRFVDTAGMRKKRVVHEDVEYYSMVRGFRAIDDADVCLLVIDASEGVTEQDQKVARMAIDRGSGLVVLLNKWDLMDDDFKREKVVEDLGVRLPYASWAPMLRISALTGRSVEKIWPRIDAAARNRALKVTTSALNRVLTEMREFGHTVTQGKRRLKTRYAVQVTTRPPTFQFFVNHADLVTDNYRRYVENRLRGAFDLEGTPVRLRFREQEQKKEG